MKRKVVNLCMVLCGVLLVSFFPYFKADAYVKNGQKLSNPQNVKYCIGSFAGAYATDIINYTKKWQDYCAEITVSQVTSGQNIYFMAEPNVNNGNYAVCYHHSNDSHTITFYDTFANASTSEKRETIVHEVGHALGLSHCQAAKESISVMRALGFNNKAYPLSDDIAGISNIY